MAAKKPDIKLQPTRQCQSNGCLANGMRSYKILWADADGLCLFTKRLEEGLFIWPAVREGKISITRSQFAMLLDKLDWRQPKTARLNSLTML